MQERLKRKPTVRSRPGLLFPEDRIVFSSGMGGLGQILTVRTIVLKPNNIVEIFTYEQEIPIEVLSQNTVKVVL